ncbi:MAG: hypothetical protein KZQ95_01815 [Candidatus Thiodiazotropha sp. (ex Epidulcina cf. delphinae)]|nr:hypothetical protein [Candidatus Thiodiazotropha sp. (ex Epidulcina cf. delphinae)]
MTVEAIANFIQKYQIKRIALLIFMMWLTRDVYDWVMMMMERDALSEWEAAAVLSPLSVLFPAVIKYMQEEK